MTIKILISKISTFQRVRNYYNFNFIISKKTHKNINCMKIKLFRKNIEIYTFIKVSDLIYSL